MSPSPLRVGSRGSALALVQSHQAITLLKQAFPTDPAVQNIALIPITTTGDRVKDQPLAEIGGKGLFSKEIEQALFANEIDFAVHSLKDMETILPPGLKLAATLKREDPRDVLISRKAPSLQALPPGSVIGTCSPRRAAQILHHRPDLICIPLRGNVDTRIKKLGDGTMDAIILALAGLRRLGRQDEATYIFPKSEMMPAVGQGAIALECRIDDARTNAYLAALNHTETFRCITAERALLAGLHGSCRTPIGGHATLEKDGSLRLEALIASPTGAPLHRTVQGGDDPISLGHHTAKLLNDLGGPGFWDQVECIS